MKKTFAIIILSMLIQGAAFAQDSDSSKARQVAACDISDNECLSAGLEAINSEVKAAYARVYQLAPLKAKTTYDQDPQGTIKRSDFVKLHQSWLEYRKNYCKIYSASMGLMPKGDFAVNAQCQIDLSKAYIVFLNTYETY